MYRLLLLVACLLLLSLAASCGRQSPTGLAPTGGPGVGQPPSTTGPGAAAPVARSVELPVTLKADDPAFSQGGFVPGDAAIPHQWYWSMGTFRGPSLRIPADGDIEIVVHLAGFYPPNANSSLTVSQGGTKLFEEKLSGPVLFNGKVVGPIRVPASVHQGQLDLLWEVGTFVPAKVGSNPKDFRNLGLDIASFEIRRASG